jgi:hypothetical protein
MAVGDIYTVIGIDNPAHEVLAVIAFCATIVERSAKLISDRLAAHIDDMVLIHFSASIH